MKELIYSITKKEWQFVVIMSAVIMLITGVPYVLGYLMAPDDMVYNGLHALSPGDIPIYYSYINQVKEGEILVKDLFTSEVQTIGTFNVWWTLVGLMAKIFNLSVIFAFQISRLLMIPIFLMVGYIFISYFFRDWLKRITALLFLLFSSGLGFYFALPIDALKTEDSLTGYAWPIDLWLTEAITFNALYQSSHFIASITITILIFLLMLLAFESPGRIIYVFASGFLALFYFNFHPYYFPVIFGVLGLYLLGLMFKAKRFLWRDIGYLTLVFLISLPSVFYHYWLVKSSPVIGQRAIQNVTNVSPLFFIILGYGFLWLGLICGLYFLFKLKKFDKKYWFLSNWLIVNVVLIVSPFPFHSRYTQGLHVILITFSVYGIFEFGKYLKSRLSYKAYEYFVNNIYLLVFLFLLLFSTSNIFSVARDIYLFAFQSAEVKKILYLPKDYFSAVKWLSTNSNNSLILASDIPSKFIPGFSGQRVYAAHAHETLFFYSKIIYTLWFFSDNRNDENKLKFLNKENIGYILYSDYEKELGTFNPAAKDYLKLVFDRPAVKVYQVVKN